MAPLIFIIGPAQHGKSTVREMICKLTGRKGGSSSDVIYHAWASLSGETEATVRAWPKEQVRPLLVALGDWLTGGRPQKDGTRKPVKDFNQNFPHHLLHGVDPSIAAVSGLEHPSASALIKYALNHGIEVLDGIRREDELAEFLLTRTSDPVILWVENPNKELIKGDNLSIKKSFATHAILNDGNFEDLEKSVKYFLHTIE